MAATQNDIRRKCRTIYVGELWFVNMDIENQLNQNSVF